MYDPTVTLAIDGTNISHVGMIMDNIESDSYTFYSSANNTFDNCMFGNVTTKGNIDPYIYLYSLSRPPSVKLRTYKRQSIPTTGSFVKGDYVENTNFSELGTTGSKYVLHGWRRLTTGSNHVLNNDWLEDRRLTGN